MKRIKIFGLLLTAIVIAGTGCLKDKGFEDHQYGINDPDNSPAGIGFNLGIKLRNTAGVLVADTAQTISGLVNVMLFSGQLATADIHVTLQVDPTIIADYDTTNGTLIEALDPTLYNFNADVVIAKGSNLAKVIVTIPTTVPLDPTKTYGIGFRITGVDAGYTIASNENRLLLEVAIKNRYDGIYSLTGFHNRDPYNFPYNVEEYMITAGPNSAAFYWPEKNDYGHPIGIAPEQTNWYGNVVAPVVVFDLTTNEITDVYNGNSGGPVISPYSGSPTQHNYYDPATKTIYVSWEYNGNPLRAFFDTLVYTGVRP